MVGQPVYFMATVAVVPPATGTPTGSVTFIFSDGRPSITVPLDLGGQAPVIVADMSAGTHQVAVVYGGDTTYNPSSSSIDFHEVSTAPSMTTVTVTPDPSAAGQIVTISAMVETMPPASGTPTGTVTFVGPGGLSQTVELEFVGEAVLTTTALESGTIVATYNGDGNFDGSVGMADIAVSAATSTTTVSVDPAVSVAGQLVEIVATVETSTGGIPTGMVTFVGPDGNNQTAPLDATGQAAIQASYFESGTITASYTSDSAAVEDSYGSADITVTPAMTTAVVSTNIISPVYGQEVMVEAIVTVDAPGSGVPTGVVQFTGAGVNETLTLDAAGTAAFTTNMLTSGTLVVTYGGDGTYGEASGTTVVTVLPAVTTTAAWPSPDSSNYSDEVTLFANVTTDAPGSGTPVGSVTFNGPSMLAQTVPLDATGTAAITTDSLTSGTITATYISGNPDAFSGSTGTATITVVPAITNIELTLSKNVSVASEPVDLIVTVSAVDNSSLTPGGTVTFTGPGGLNTSVTLDATGQAALTTSTLSTGTVTATYNGIGPMFSPSSDSRGITVDPAVSTTQLTVTPNPSVYGEMVSVAVAVTGEAPATTIPTGSVAFSDSNGFYQIVPLDGSGQAELTTTALTTGTLTASYYGDAVFNGSTDMADVTINPADTSTTVVAIPDPSTTGEMVEIYATVTAEAPGSGTPEGTVTFTGPNGFNQTVALDATGIAGFTTTALKTGTVTATYNGDANFNGSQGTVDVTVDQGGISVALTATPDVSIFGLTVTLTAQVEVLPPASGHPSGSITFMDGSNELAVIDLSQGEASFSTSELSVGTHSINAVYNGDDNFSSASSEAVEVTIEAAFHSADTDFDWQLSLAELTRVIELYNTRDGDVRTGEYHFELGTEDGFAPGPGLLPTFHSADVDQNGKLSLTELTRVIELYNTRDGDTRTGAYHTQADTEDGFAPGPELDN